MGTSIGLFLHLATERGWSGLGTEFGRRALAYARDELALEAVDTPIEELDGELRRRHGALRARARQPAARVSAPRSGGCSSRAARSYLIVPNVDSLATRVLHERAATFDGRNHLLYFSPRRFATLLEREGFDVVETQTRVASLDPCSSGSPTASRTATPTSPATRLPRPFGARRAEVERLLEELDLGYKLHCLAVRKP